MKKETDGGNTSDSSSSSVLVAAVVAIAKMVIRVSLMHGSSLSTNLRNKVAVLSSIMFPFL